MNQTLIRTYAAALGSSVWAALSPTVPNVLFCTAMVCLDVITACSLARRVAAAYPDKAQRPVLRSRRLGSTVRTIARAYAFLLIAACIDRIILRNTDDYALRIATGAIVFWQGISVLENIVSCNNNRWARVLRRFLADKTSRHIS